MEDYFNKSIKDIIDTFLEIKHTGGDENLLKLFSFYISSNPDFKYNITYLTDSIHPFVEARKELQSRYAFFRKIAEEIAKQTPFMMEGILVFDNFFKFSISYLNVSKVEYVNIDRYRFDKIDKKNYIIKFVLGDERAPTRSETNKLNFNPINGKIHAEEANSEVAIKWMKFIK